jgi:hypothetical protein
MQPFEKITWKTWNDADIPSKASCMPPTIGWQLVQTHEAVALPSCASKGVFPKKVKKNTLQL